MCKEQNFLFGHNTIADGTVSMTIDFCGHKVYKCPWQRKSMNGYDNNSDDQVMVMLTIMAMAIAMANDGNDYVENGDEDKYEGDDEAED